MAHECTLQLLTVEVDKHLWEVEELGNDLLDVTGCAEDVLIGTF